MTHRDCDNRVLLSVVIPAYNEERRIARTLQDIAQFVGPGAVLDGDGHRLALDNLEIIVADDGSTDATREVVRQTAHRMGMEGRLRLVPSPVNQGKGHAVRSGVLASRGLYVLFCDADGATPFREVRRLFAALTSGYDVAIGSRDAPGARVVVPQPPHRRVLGALMRVFVRRLVVGGFRDTQCGFKLFRGQVARDIFSRQVLNGFSFDVEVLFLARQLGYSVCEVPIEWHDQPGSKVDPLRSPLQMLGELIRIRWLHRHLTGASRRAAWRSAGRRAGALQAAAGRWPCLSWLFPWC